MTQVSTTQSNKPATLKSFFDNPNVQSRFEQVLGEKTKSAQFISSVLQLANGNDKLKKADPMTIYNSALMAATLNLPVNQNLGFAYILPYGNVASFILGYKGIIQLAQRTGQYKAINAVEVYANQFKSYNALTEELDADFSVLGQGDVVGFAAYFKLINGFEKTSYWPVEKVQAHGKKYSKTYTSGPWKTDFNAMGKKTVLKLMISTYGPMSIEMQKAMQADQAVIKNEEGTELEYVDHEEVAVNPESDRLIALINSCNNVDDLGAFEVDVDALNDAEVRAVYIERYEALKGSDEEKK
jgi:recombination protein RecT